MKYHIDHKIKTAHAFENEGKLLHAAQIYISIINEYPDFADAYFNLAHLYEKLGNINPAIELLNSLLEINSENKDARLFYGQFLLRNSRWEEAIEVLGFILPEEEPVVAFFLGYSHFMLTEFELSKISFSNFVSVEKDNELIHEAYIYLAKIEIKLKNFESALAFAKKADVLYSNFWELNHIYAETYFNLGMFAHAVAPVEKAIKLNQSEPSPYELAGKIYLKLGDYQKAEKYFLKFIELIDDASSDIYAKLAEACLKSSKPFDALAYFDIAIKLDPENKLAVEGKKSTEQFLNNNAVSDG
ncbi:MAG: tetratricopeptide repeat protein [Ignavibacteriaceae bacterium]